MPRQYPVSSTGPALRETLRISRPGEDARLGSGCGDVPHHAVYRPAADWRACLMMSVGRSCQGAGILPASPILHIKENGACK